MKARASIARRYAVLCWALAAIAIGACSGGSFGGGSVAGLSFGPSTSATCGPPPPVPFTPLYLSYPEPHATGVSENVKLLVFAGWDKTFFGKDTVHLIRLHDGQPVQSLKFTKFVPAPSPLPSPYATPSDWQGYIPFVAVNIPKLQPVTRYVVSYTYKDWGDKPPSCRTRVTKRLGSFTTGS